MKNTGLRLVLFFCIFGSFLLPTTALAARTVTAVSLNAADVTSGGSVSVQSGGSIPVSITVEITNDSLWQSTGWLISATPPSKNADYACVDTPDTKTNGSHTVSFNAAVPSAEGVYSLYIATFSDGSAGDALGGPNDGTCTSGTSGAANFAGAVVVDNTAPAATLASPAPDPTNTAISVTASFSEPIVRFDPTKISVSGGSVDRASIATSSDNLSASFTVVPSGDGIVSVSLLSGATADAAGNQSAPSNGISRTYTAEQPHLALSPSPAPQEVFGPFQVNLNSTVGIVDFSADAIQVTNGVASDVEMTEPGNGTNFTFTVMPTADGDVAVVIPQGAVKSAAGNGNIASNILQTNYASSTDENAASSTATTDTDENAASSTDAVLNYPALGGEIFVPTSGDASSTPSIQTLAATNTVQMRGSIGTSTVVIPPSTIISKIDGSNLNIGDFTVGTTSQSSLSGLGQGVVVDGALQWGIPGAGLAFSNPITISIFVGDDFDGQTLTVYRSPNPDSGWTQDGLADPGTCLVADGLCTFNATHASYYAATHTVQSTPSTAATATGGGGGGTVAGPLAVGYQQPAGLVLGAETEKATSTVSSVPVVIAASSTPRKPGAGRTVQKKARRGSSSSIRTASSTSASASSTAQTTNVFHRLWGFVASLFHW
jgi:hypothetical protein